MAAKYLFHIDDITQIINQEKFEKIERILNTY